MRTELGGVTGRYGVTVLSSLQSKLAGNVVRGRRHDENGDIEMTMIIIKKILRTAENGGREKWI